jgi:putative nucleotidyltransferase with HDIG domain
LADLGPARGARARLAVKTCASAPINRPMRVSRIAPLVALVCAAAAGFVAVLSSHADDWRHPAVLAVLFAFAVVADRFEITTRTGSALVGNMPVFVLAAALFGPAPAVAIAVAASLTQPRKNWKLVAGDLAVFATFPLLTGFAVRAVHAHVPASASPWFALVVAGAYLLSWSLNVALVVAYMRALRGRDMRVELATIWRPLVSTQLALALATAALAYAYVRLGAAAIVFAGGLIVAYSRLQRDLMAAEHLRDEAQERNEELAAANERLRRAHFGAMRSLVRSIHLHDQMTARHSAAVARYARGIAKAAGCSEDEQQLVHTAGLLHDVGKHILDDAILKGDTKLDDSQWELVKRHPEEGARIVRLLEGQEAVAEIIHAHHERVDGRGYPRGLAGEQIPRLARMISIADTYDVMTARDSYRDPVSSAAAVAELRRVSGAQLDAELVEIFVHAVLGHEEASFAHGDDADFETELAGGMPEALDAEAAPQLTVA